MSTTRITGLNHPTFAKGRSIYSTTHLDIGTRCSVVTLWPLNAKSSFGSKEHWKERKWREGFSSVRSSVKVEAEVDSGETAGGLESDDVCVPDDFRDRRARGSEAGSRNVGAGIVVVVLVGEC